MEGNERSPFILSVGNIQRKHRRPHCCRRTPDPQQKTDRQGKPDDPLRRVEEQFQLFFQRRAGCVREQIANLPQKVPNIGRLREQAIERGRQTQRGEQREKSIKPNARRRDGQVLFSHRCYRSPQNPFPSQRRNVEGHICVSAQISCTFQRHPSQQPSITRDDRGRGRGRPADTSGPCFFEVTL